MKSNLGKSVLKGENSKTNANHCVQDEMAEICLETVLLTAQEIQPRKIQEDQQ